MTKPSMSTEQREKLERTAAWAKRVATLTNEVLAVFTEETEFPPLPLPSDLNGWLATRWQVRQLQERSEAELKTVEGG